MKRVSKGNTSYSRTHEKKHDGYSFSTALDYAEQKIWRIVEFLFPPVYSEAVTGGF